MRKQVVPPIVGLLLAAGALACNLPSPDQPGPTSSPSHAPTTEGPVSTVSTAEPTSDPAEIESFTQILLQALVEEDYSTLEALMGEAFLMQYRDGASGFIAVADAIQLLESELLSGPQPVAFDRDADPATLSDVPAASQLQVQETILSTGWGATNRDQAILLISLTDDTQPYFSGVIYARGGFPNALQPTPEATSDAVQATASQSLPTPSPAPRGPVVYQSDMTSGWFVFEDNLGRGAHTDAGYQLDLFEQAKWVFTTRLNEDQFYVEVAASPLICPTGQGLYGLIFHYRDGTHFRVFAISCGGRYTLVERTEETRATLLAEGILPGGIDAASGEHRIGVHAEGNNLALYINDILLASIGVGEMPGGDIGIFAETTGSQTTSILFSDLAVYEPR